jgi:hypothetical protein
MAARYPFHMISFCRFLALAVMIFTITSCSREPEQADFVGEYIYHYPDGEMEVLELHGDLTYVHELYASVSDYKQHSKPICSFENTWSHRSRRLTMNRWMMFYDFSAFEVGKPKIPPTPMVDMPGGWVKPTSESDAGILFAEDLGYNFLRIQSREAMKDGPWQTSP